MFNLKFPEFKFHFQSNGTTATPTQHYITGNRTCQSTCSETLPSLAGSMIFFTHGRGDSLLPHHTQNAKIIHAAPDSALGYLELHSVFSDFFVQFCRIFRINGVAGIDFRRIFVSNLDTLGSRREVVHGGYFALSGSSVRLPRPPERSFLIVRGSRRGCGRDFR